MQIEEIGNNLAHFLSRVDLELKKYGRPRESLSVLLAVKYLSPEIFMELHEKHISRFSKEWQILYGENMVQEGIRKKQLFAGIGQEETAPIPFCLIGSLQRNKISKALGVFDGIHSVDSFGLLDGILKRMPEGKVMPVMLEVNLSKEKAKHGFREEDLGRAVKAVGSAGKLKLEGLMTLAPDTKDEGVVRDIFKRLKILASRYKLKTSMGMTSDWKIAIEEGADMIRVGRGVFCKEMRRES